MKSSCWLWAVVCAALGALGLNAAGSMVGGYSLEINFQNEVDAAAKATWGRSGVGTGRLDVTAGGLGWDGEAAGMIEGWIQTKPLAVGLSYRPAQSLGLHVTLTPDPKPIRLNSGQMHTPYGGGLFVRYSPDGKNWSSWQELGREKTDGTTREYRGIISVPRRERAEYEELLETYRSLPVPWVNDEEAAAGWILQRKPKFFEEHLPFIGYVEFLFETGFMGGQRITSLNARASFGVSGWTMPANDPTVTKDRHGPWRFKAP